MKIGFLKSCLVAASCVLLSSFPVQAQEEAASLDALIKLIESAKIGESADHKAREAEFIKAKENQQSLLNQAKSTQDSEERRSGELEKTYADNELKIQALQKQLNERLGSLKELFGHLTSTAGDVRATINQSIVSAEYPGRTDFIDDLIAKMGSDTKLPTIAEIERLWAEMSREMAESGKVVKFPATIVKVDGEQVQQEVVRVGIYNLVSEGAYLDYNPKSGLISELARQPKSAYTSGAANLQSATEGFTAMGIDPSGPSGGNLLKALIDTPTITEKWHQGGLVGYIISGVGAFAVVLALWRFLILTGISAKVSSQLKNLKTANTNNPLGRILKVAEENPGMDAESLELKLHEAVLKERPAIEAGLNLLKIIAMVAPLLGLLGTVTGMINTFQQITIFGAGDPKAMAGGISQALVTTVLGLVVAIPTVLMNKLVNGRAQRVLHIIEEQSAGIIAENAEG